MDRVDISLEEVVAELDPLGRALYQKAEALAANKKLFAHIGKLQGRITELEKMVELLEDALPAGSDSVVKHEVNDPYDPQPGTPE